MLLARNRAENAGASRVFVLVYDHRRITVKPNIAAVWSSRRLLGSDNHCLNDGLLLDVAPRNDTFDATHDNVTQTGRPSPRAAKYFDALDLACAGVVGNLQSCF